ncbi:hypothetical protein [Alicyclobacillus herbarius]|uniref:exo-rhamnogalacturonan lyase family protein n=1 Tax=Alicyclobacillus herbarius TaxID=122960 RepID=UPI000423A18D|nr:hypothetical protein [Alicyclobacillus herbarius]
MSQVVSLRWLEHKPDIPVGVTWGVPWPRGSLQSVDRVALRTESGQHLMVQSWPTAFWPDGSIKWTGHAAVIQPDASVTYRLSAAALPADRMESVDRIEQGESRLRVTQTDEYVLVDAGRTRLYLNRRGTEVVRSIERSGELVCTGGQLVCIRETRECDSVLQVRREEPYIGTIKQVTVEQAGPIRAVVRVDGVHTSRATGQEWLPFCVRFYVYQDIPSVRVIHTFLYDGEADRDFIKGIGMVLSLSLKGKPYNRHIRFVGDDGVFSEASRLLTTRQFANYDGLYEKQIQGVPLVLDGKDGIADADFLRAVDDAAIWNDFKMFQDSPDHYLIQKRTSDACAWIHAAHGGRSQGVVYAGGETGGLALGIRHFWRKYPKSIEVHGLSTDSVRMTAWLWAPDAPAMDLRHYDTTTHMVSAYEGFNELRSTPFGIANTGEINLWLFESTPPKDTLLTVARETETPSLLVCSPDYYHATKVFGVWSLRDETTKARAWLEAQLDKAFAFYHHEVEQRRWYGFWDYGDVMHTYDPVRHTWRYDMGGFAWQNTELVPNLWLWYMFLRSGRADVFRFAEAMTRHTSEVDVYHIGPYAGLGSRHNVVHWGCGCKEARISMAGLHRFYYYLTSDERIGDILDEVKDADYATARLDPMREYFPPAPEFPTHTRSGPDWAAFCSNWLTRWERYQDTTYRDKILRGIQCLKQMPFRLCSGPTFGYNPETGDLYHLGDDNYDYHMVVAFGATETWMELMDLIDDPDWVDMLVEFAEFSILDEAGKRERSHGKITNHRWNLPMFYARLVALAASRKGGEALAKKAWELILQQRGRGVRLPLSAAPIPERDWIRPIEEISWLSTNSISQWSLSVIECLELIGEHIPDIG